MTRMIGLTFVLLTAANILCGGQASSATGGKSGASVQDLVQNQDRLPQAKEENSILEKMLKRTNHANFRLNSDLQGIAGCESSKAIS